MFLITFFLHTFTVFILTINIFFLEFSLIIIDFILQNPFNHVLKSGIQINNNSNIKTNNNHCCCCYCYDHPFHHYVCYRYASACEDLSVCSVIFITQCGAVASPHGWTQQQDERWMCFHTISCVSISTHVFLMKHTRRKATDKHFWLMHTCCLLAVAAGSERFPPRGVLRLSVRRRFLRLLSCSPHRLLQVWIHAGLGGAGADAWNDVATLVLKAKPVFGNPHSYFKSV